MKKSNISGIVVLALLGASYISPIFNDATNDAPKTTYSSPTCDPNYSGCVPIASDVDCAGRGGNGPEYVRGPVEVIGNDIYGLDGDHDGIGCE